MAALLLSLGVVLLSLIFLGAIATGLLRRLRTMTRQLGVVRRQLDGVDEALSRFSAGRH